MAAPAATASAGALLGCTVRVADVGAAENFYASQLGMDVLHQAGAAGVGAAARLGWDGPGGTPRLQLQLVGGAAAGQLLQTDTRRDHFVWLGLANLPDVAAAVSALRAAGVAGAKLQGQFLDIGFVAHLEDPSSGIKLELLQATMEATFAAGPPPQLSSSPLRAPDPTFAQVSTHCAIAKSDDRSGRLMASRTLIEWPCCCCCCCCSRQVKLNTKNPDRELAFWCDGLGMRLLSRQRAPQYSLCLFFLGFGSTGGGGEEPPPTYDPDDAAAACREWLWRAPFGQLELQHWEVQTL